MDTGAMGKSQALRLYARQRKDAELEVQMAEIRCAPTAASATSAAGWTARKRIVSTIS
jgi:hypothetical protein